MVRFLFFLLLLFVGGIGYSVITGGDVASWLPLGLSVLAVLISLISAFRPEILPVQLVVAGGDLVLSPPKTQADLANITVALNLSFLNKGYGQDVIEWVGMRVVSAAGSRDFIPVAETDLKKVMAGVAGDGKLKKIHATNSTSFTSFVLHAKSSLAKTIVFVPKDVPGPLPTGKLSFRVFVKFATRPEAKHVHTVEHTVDQPLLDSVGAGMLSLTQAHEVRF